MCLYDFAAPARPSLVDFNEAVTFAALQMRQERLRLLQERIELLKERGITTAHLLGLLAKHHHRVAAFEAGLETLDADVSILSQHCAVCTC